MDSSEALSAVRAMFPAKVPAPFLIGSPTELQLVPSDLLEQAPNERATRGNKPVSRESASVGRHLWVIDDHGVPYLLERPMKECGGFLPKHSNVTGGQAAYVGGEVWFVDGRRLFVSGGSGRYPPASEDHLEAAVNVFRGFMYDVTSLGWDHETGFPRRYLRAEN